MTDHEPPSRAIRSALLRWYDEHSRDLPWRCAPGERADPYHVWVSEVMLQQTRVEAVRPYFERWIERFPHVRVTYEAVLCAHASGSPEPRDHDEVRWVSLAGVRDLALPRAQQRIAHHLLATDDPDQGDDRLTRPRPRSRAAPHAAASTAAPRRDTPPTSAGRARR